MVDYKKASLSDIPKMQTLVQPYVLNGLILPRSNDEIATNIRSYTLASSEEKIIGFGALHFHAPTLAEVRSLVVDASFNAKGIGSKIVNLLLEEASFFGVKKVFTLTYRKTFFEKLGFEEIQKEELPEHKIWADCIKCKHFPICDEIALIKII